ncbi:MAG: UDP-N-acetylmuramoyl-L-alanine--D-glutamate ligase [Peptococcaceae bacterium]|nr:UDP-N-acetylmuramoyl-L-alanine--D-glutamate ligase [Peptococcaceae bacterium]
MKVVVVGAGMSGAAAAALLYNREDLVYLMDTKEAAELPFVRDLILPEEQRVFGREMTLANVPGGAPDLMVLSPGVPPKAKVVQEALTEGIPIWSEVELALTGDSEGDLGAVVVGVTGSNGKTTTTSLIGVLAGSTGKRSVVAGNIGLPLAGLSPVEYDYVVAELSSFQLAFLDRLRIPIAVLLNVTPDHLDWHGSFEEYAEAKGRIFRNQLPGDLCVINWDCPVCRRLSEQAQSRRVFFSSTVLLDTGWGLEKGWIVRRCDGRSQPVVAVDELQLKGAHNYENVMAALAVGEELRLSDADLAGIVSGFAPVRHRQEVVGTFDGVLFVNDSKATNPDSAIKALASYAQPIVLLAGGKNKGLDMTQFMEAARGCCRCVVFYGEAADELRSAAAAVGIPRMMSVGSFAEAVKAAIAVAEAGDVVLLSPGCTSWDAFKNYEERGACFRELVREHFSG